MKNKIQMLMFIIAKPPVILLDEPLTSLDVVVALEIKKILREIRKDHIIIFSTHILQLATDLCDEIVALSDGELELLDHTMLKSNDFEEKLVKLLSEEATHA
jgi:ABC-2 type transport system ATP-binding protein